MGVNECSETICDRQIVEKVHRKSLTSINVTLTRPQAGLDLIMWTLDLSGMSVLRSV